MPDGRVPPPKRVLTNLGIYLGVYIYIRSVSMTLHVGVWALPEAPKELFSPAMSAQDQNG
jgi:hypothetical protein